MPHHRRVVVGNCRMKRKPRKRPAGHGTVWLRGWNWWIEWRDGGRRQSAKFPSEDTARRVLARIVGDLAAGRGGLEAAPRDLPTLATLATTWLSRREKTHRAWRDDRNRWTKHLKPFLGSCKPNEVNTATIRHFIEVKLAEGLSSTSVGHCVRLLSTFFTDVGAGLRAGQPGEEPPACHPALVPQRPRSEADALPREAGRPPAPVPRARPALRHALRGASARRPTTRGGARA